MHRPIDIAINKHQEVLDQLPPNTDPLLKECLKNKLQGMKEIRDQNPEPMHGIMVQNLIAQEMNKFSEGVQKRHERGEAWNPATGKITKAKYN